jgi:hypothetical protein
MLRAGVILRRDAAIGLHIFMHTLFGTGESRRESPMRSKRSQKRLTDTLCGARGNTASQGGK